MDIEKALRSPVVELQHLQRFVSHGSCFLLSIMVNMKDEVKLVVAFLALNAGVIALAVAGYTKGGMNIGSVIGHLGS